MPSFAGFRLPEELTLLREQVRRFVRDEIIPVEQRIDPDAPDIPEEDFKRLSQKTKAAGLWALGAPEEYGGGGMDTFSMAVLVEEMAQHRMGLYNTGCGVFGRYPPPAIWAGTAQQIEKYAVPMIQEGYETFWAITEPSGGSDPAGAIQTRAEKRGDRWVLNGRKVFISRAHDAPWGVVFARTDKAKGRAGISCFILEKGAPGFHATPIRTIRTASVPNDVVFEDCEIPAENLIGKEGEGFKVAMQVLDRGRLHISSVCIGVAERLIADCVAYASERKQFGQALSNFQLIQGMIADSKTEALAAKALTLETARKRDAGQSVTMEAAAAKYFASEMVGRVADRAVQIFGGAGYIADYGIERFYRDVRIFRIYEGTSQIQQVIIARETLKRGG